MAAVIDRILRRSGEERTLRPDTGPAMMFGGSPLPLPSIAGGSITTSNAMQIVDVLACVRAISEAVACLPLHGFRKLPEGRERLAGGRLVSLLEQPAPAVSQAAFFGAVAQSLACSGNAWLGLFSDESGQVAQLGLLHPESVTVEIRNGEPRYRLTHTDSGRQTEHTTEDILHIRLPVVDSSGILGLSPIGQAREALGLAKSLTDQASAMAVNSSAPLGVLSVTSGPGAEDVMANLKTDFEMRHRGSANRGRIAVLSADVSFAPISLSPKDSEFVAQMQASTATIARLFRCPGFVVGAQTTDSLTYATTESMQRAFAVLCVQMYCVVIEQAISNHPRLCSERSFVEFERAAWIEADTKTQADVLTQALDPATGWMTRAEARARLNLPPEQATPEAA